MFRILIFNFVKLIFLYDSVIHCRSFGKVSPANFILNTICKCHQVGIAFVDVIKNILELGPLLQHARLL
jgi:hypothetical protein